MAEAAATECCFESTAAEDDTGCQFTSAPAHENEEGESQVESSEPSKSITTCAQVEDFSEGMSKQRRLKLKVNKWQTGTPYTVTTNLSKAGKRG